MTPLKAAVIGLGIGRSHAAVLAAMAGVDLVAVADLKNDVLAQIAAETGARAYADGAELMAKEQLDFVSICTTPATHLAFTRDAAARGVHVFCEKPMAPTLDDCNGMIAACAEHGVKLMIGQKKRFHPLYRFVKDGIGGDLGPVRWASIRYACGRVPMPWFWDEADGGGPLMENAVHAIDMLRHLMGDVERVHAEGGNMFNDQWAPQLDAAAASLKFRSGAVATASCGQTSEWGFASEAACFATERAVVEIDGGFDNPQHLRYALRDDPRNAVDKTIDVPNLFELELSHFIDCIRAGAEPLVTGESARDSLAVCFAIKESIRTGRSVEMA